MDWESFRQIWSNFSPYDFVDILFAAFLVYWVLVIIKGTRSIQMFFGLLLLFIIFWLSDVFQLAVTHSMLSMFFVSIAILIVVIFQEDIRRALATVGAGLPWQGAGKTAGGAALEEIVRACQLLREKKIGALIVLERDQSLGKYIELGTPIDGRVTRDLIVSIFIPYSPLHDGAVVVKSGRITTAGCILPLSLSPNISRSLGTRHRAAIGLTEVSDAVVVVVSEEQGKISVVAGGEITFDLDPPHLRERLIALTGAWEKVLKKKEKKRSKKGDAKESIKPAAEERIETPLI